MNPLDSVFGWLRSITLEGLIVVFILGVVLPLVLWETLQYPSIVVNPISVPPELA